MKYYNVAVLGAKNGGDKSLTYQSQEKLTPGQAVKVPIGQKSAYGVVINTTKKPKFQTKSLSTVAQPALPKYYLELASWISKFYGSSVTQTLQTMLPRGFGKIRRSPFKPDYDSTQTSFIELSRAQQEIVNSVKTSDKRSHLLHGATGSGKTHIYLSLIKNAISAERSTILLVPEIALSRHLLERIKPLLSVPLIELSSDLTVAQRHTRWNFISEADEPLVIVGPRSAVFAPVKNLGMIIIDEAHDNSFIETSRPHYDATYVAAKRTELEQATLVMGTATPSVSQYWLAQKQMQIHKLPTAHYNQTEQQITTVDLSNKSLFKENRSLSTPLLNSISDSLAKQKQSLLFINKRGFSRNIHCTDCGWIMECDTCQLPIVYHKQDHRARCHTCGKKFKPPTQCASCDSTEIRFDRPGTQRIEQDVIKQFPKAKVIRADRDQKQSETEIQAADILIGTQLLIKGFDLPRLNTVGVLHADSGLGLPDYNASETVFQQLRQVIGRNNRRGLGGRTFVQALQTEHHAITTAIAGDYQLFYETELEQRRASNYPPFTHLMLIKSKYKTEKTAAEKLSVIKSEVEQNQPELTVLGPTPALRQFAFGYHHWQLLVKSTKRSDLVQLANKFSSNRIDAQINPPSLL